MADQTKPTEGSMSQRELWVVESRYLPAGEEFRPLRSGISFTERNARFLAEQHEKRYSNEPCRVVRYVPEDASGKE